MDIDKLIEKWNRRIERAIGRKMTLREKLWASLAWGEGVRLDEFIKEELKQ